MIDCCLKETAPKSGAATYEQSGDGIKRSGDTVSADGKTTLMQYTANYDGKDYPVTGTDIFDTISVRKINDHTSTVSLKKDGKVVNTGRRMVSKDGKTMTTTSGTNAKGEKTHNIMVYEKQ